MNHKKKIKPLVPVKESTLKIALMTACDFTGVPFSLARSEFSDGMIPETKFIFEWLLYYKDDTINQFTAFDKATKYGVTLNEIASYVKVVHASVLYGCKRINKLMSERKIFEIQMKNLREIFESRLWGDLINTYTITINPDILVNNVKVADPNYTQSFDIPAKEFYNFILYNIKIKFIMKEFDIFKKLAELEKSNPTSVIWFIRDGTVFAYNQHAIETAETIGLHPFKVGNVITITFDHSKLREYIDMYIGVGNHTLLIVGI